VKLVLTRGQYGEQAHQENEAGELVATFRVVRQPLGHNTTPQAIGFVGILGWRHFSRVDVGAALGWPLARILTISRPLPNHIPATYMPYRMDRADELTAIASFTATRGVTCCPTRFVAPVACAVPLAEEQRRLAACSPRSMSREERRRRFTGSSRSRR
jgi:hypothetical protein